MTSDISSQTLKGHQCLINTIDELIVVLRRLPNDVQWGDSTWAQDMTILDFIRIQTISLENVMKNVIQGYYRDSYHLIRMIFEGYFTLRLISTCDKYPIRIEIKKGGKDTTLDDARNRMIEQAQKVFGSRLLRTYMEKGSNTLVAIVCGVPVVNDRKEETGITIPYYYGAWQEFQPVEYYLKRKNVTKKYSTLRFLKGKWGGLPDTRSDLHKKYERLHRYYLNFDRMLENLRLNGILNNRSATRVLVHYNFLSNFSHCTSDSVSLISTRRLHQVTSQGLENIYDHYFTELALLYVCHLLSMHLQHAIYYLRWRGIKLKNENKLYRSLYKKFEDEFGYFWFIFNKPHQYDIFDYANRKCNYKKRIFYRPEDIRLGNVRYYDNPLYRLKQLHQSQRELLTGNIFVSPFHRDDASFEFIFG
ncbi:hypothetical protein ACFLWG_04730 [Chloroflexota bacterium]